MQEDLDLSFDRLLIMMMMILTSTQESLGLHELKQNKPWFDEECLGFLDQRKRAKMQRI